MTRKLTPNSLAAELDKRAKLTPPDVEGLEENEKQYVLHVHDVLKQFRSRLIDAEQAKCDRKWYQVKYLQSPGMEEIIKLWTTSNF